MTQNQLPNILAGLFTQTGHTQTGQTQTGTPLASKTQHPPRITSPITTLGQGPGVPIKQTMAGMTHWLIAFLFDTSKSMAQGPNPDIIAIREMAQNIINDLKANPPAGVRIEGCIIGYDSDAYLIQPWAGIEDMVVPPLTANGCTSSGKAVIAAADYIERRKQLLRANPGMPVPYTAPHLLHFTDGAPNDMQVGDTLWNDSKAMVASFSPAPEKDPYQCVTHFVAPNGCVPGQNGQSNQAGAAVSGKEVLSMWTGSDTVFELLEAPSMYASLGKVLVQSITGHTRQAGTIHDLLKRYGGKTIRSAQSKVGSKVAGE